MTELFLSAVATQVILFLVGLSILQLGCRNGQRLPILPAVPYAWGLGVVFLYVTGSFCVRFNILPNNWHLFVLVCAVLVVVVGGHRFTRAAKRAPREIVSHLSQLEWLLIALLVCKTAVILFVLMTNPVIDSDAANTDRWVGLGKLISQARNFEGLADFEERLAPSLLPSWISRFLPRWHDNLVSLPWFFTYLALVGVSGVAAYQLTDNRRAGFICSYFFASIPLAITHTIRPGYADLLVAYFLLTGISAVAFAYYRTFHFDRLVVWTILLVSMVGCIMSKKEGGVWAVWLAVTWFVNSLHQRKMISWPKILFVEGVIIGLAYLTYFTTADFFLKTISMDKRISWLFMKQFNYVAIENYATDLFEYGSFNLWWWIVAILLTVLLVQKTDAATKVLCGHVLLLLIALSYFLCFTGNISYTMQGTNAGRFLLQLTGLMLPLYAALVRNFYPVTETADAYQKV